MKLSSLSVFFPAFNEEKNIEKTVLAALAKIPAVADRFEIIIVNDGSVDKTLEIAERLVREHEEVRVVSHHPNRGYGGALKRGFLESKFDWIFYTDADGQFDISEIEKFVVYTDNYDLIIGYRMKRSEGFKRVINASLYKILIFLVFGFWAKDIDCAFKLIRRKVFTNIGPLWSDGALISAEYLIEAKRKGFKIMEVGVSHYPRLYGKPTGANPKVILKMFIELFRMWRRLREG